MSSWASPRLLNPKAPEDESGLLLYEPYYGLAEKPFSLSTDPRFLYKSPSHTPVFQDVLAGIRRREGLVVLTGEIGMGKTTLCRSVLGALDRKTFSAFVPDPFVTREDLLKILLVEFGVISVDDLVRGRLQGASRAELSYPLYEFLRSLEPLDAYAVLLIDEAQNLPVPLLEEIRILSDLEGARRLLQVVLIGQPELSAALQLPHMRQMKQRVTTHAELLPLTREAVYGYVGHRLTIAGASADRLQFTSGALDLVFEATGGVPRVINRLCDRALQRGHAEQTAIIGDDLLRAAMGDLQLHLSAAPPAAVLASVAAEAAIAQPAPRPEPVAVPPVVALPPTVAPPAVEPVAQAPAAADPDDLRALLDLSPISPPPAPSVASPRPERAPVSSHRRMRYPHRAQARPGRGRAVAAAALVVLGAMSGVTLALYWLWAGPALTAATIPAVKRPSMRIAAPPPAVLPSALEVPVGDPLPLDPPAANPDASEPAAPVVAPTTTPVPAARDEVWVVQVGAFTEDRRASVLVTQLAARGLTAFKSVTALRSGSTLHVVLVGPYPSRAAASAALDVIEELPGIGEPFIQIVPPAFAARQ